MQIPSGSSKKRSKKESPEAGLAVVSTPAARLGDIDGDLVQLLRYANMQRQEKVIASIVLHMTRFVLASAVWPLMGALKSRKRLVIATEWTWNSCLNSQIPKVKTGEEAIPGMSAADNSNL